MGSSGSNLPDIFGIYSTYCDIMSKHGRGGSRDALAEVLNSLESRYQTSDELFSDLAKLMSHLDLSVDSLQFSCFYEFVFFVCRENGQKNITVKKALHAWNLVLRGRFRLLDKWCTFVEENQRHNISEDTWQQLLAFSRCVNEDLEGYDPKGAWPVLIDDFAEHMYRCRADHSNDCCSQMFCCNCGDIGSEPSISNTLRGLKLYPGSKRKSLSNREEEAKSPSDYSTASSYISRCKRLRKPTNMDMTSFTNPVGHVVDMNRQSPFGCPNNSACAVEDSLSKVSDGQFSTACCLQFGNQSRV